METTDSGTASWYYLCKSIFYRDDNMIRDEEMITLLRDQSRCMVVGPSGSAMVGLCYATAFPITNIELLYAQTHKYDPD